MAPTVGGSRTRGNRAFLGLYSGLPSNLFAPDLRVFPYAHRSGCNRRGLALSHTPEEFRSFPRQVRG